MNTDKTAPKEATMPRKTLLALLTLASSVLADADKALAKCDMDLPALGFVYLWTLTGLQVWLKPAAKLTAGHLWHLPGWLS